MVFLHHSPQTEEMLHTITSFPFSLTMDLYPKHLHQLSLASFSAITKVIAR